jgi:hypothetical protein
MRSDSDNLSIGRQPAGGAYGDLLRLDATGLLNLLGDLAGTVGSAVVLGAGIAKGRVLTNVGAPAVLGLTANRNWLSGNAQDDASKPSWGLLLGSSDNLLIQRSPAGSTTQTALLSLDNTGSVFTTGANANLTIGGAVAIKASGTAWANPSDRRLKDEIEDYATGLAAILQLQPRTFVYNGKGGSTAGMRGYGFIADEVAPIMPETVSTRAGKLDAADEEETDIQTLDQSNLILALVNAVKELAARVDAR